MTRLRFFAHALISGGKFSENQSSILITKAKATKLLMISLKFLTCPIAIIRMHSVTIGEMNYIVHSMKLTNLPLFPSFADFVYFKYLMTHIDCLTSSKIFM